MQSIDRIAYIGFTIIAEARREQACGANSQRKGNSVSLARVPMPAFVISDIVSQRHARIASCDLAIEE
jgi:hypothetical protein